MNLMNGLANGFTAISRKLPKHRKINQIYKHFNWLFLTLGTQPIVMATMDDGTRIKVDLTTRTERMAYYSGGYDSELLEIIIKLLKPDNVFLDVGANIGFYSVAVSEVFRKMKSKGKVVSFEPFKGNYERLKFNIKTNGLEDYCLINTYGLSDEAGTNVITLREDFKHGSSTGNAAIPTSESMDEGFKKSTIDLKKLDDVWNTDFNQLGKIEIIKMDIEGHEDFCLKGGLKTIEESRPTLLMEVNKPYYKSRGVDLDNTFFPLIPVDYKVFRKVNNEWMELSSLEECRKLDNVFIIPVEKLSTSAYAMFKASI
ncbi:FkbM family methyltransferase [Nonlabens antarcticus]|uniref:FkbM family methyltransferase n=1 Tax=Nonlabens antarcticus TaxID=392714 RepID=UPI001891263E|nr:FkbM family methyltransferase [Nonlabens antarcticus]